MSFLPQCFRQFRQLSSGNVTMMFALGAPVLAMGVAVAVDYTNHTIIESKLQAAADAAALAALTPTMLKEPVSVAQAAATAMFNARASAVTSLIAGDTQVSVSVAADPNNPLMREVEVDYSAQGATIFAQVLNVSSMGVIGKSKAQASIPPNVNFYLLLDNSPSMLLPSTSAGIAQMEALTPLQDQSGGQNHTCAFACHQASTNNGDTAGNPCTSGGSTQFSPTQTYTYTDSTGTYDVPNALCPSQDAQGNPVTQIDNYTLSQQNHIQLRIQELSIGVTTLMQTAFDWQTQGQWATPPTYKFAAYAMDQATTVGTSNLDLMDLTDQYQSSWSTASNKFSAMEMFANNEFCANPPNCTSGTQTLNNVPHVQDAATNYDVALSSINATITSDPGYGSNVPGDKPQEMIFFVTDGVEDEQSGGGRLVSTINGGGSTDYCSLIKARGIKIAVLYTQYLAVTSNQFYNDNVAQIQNNIGPALQACASTVPGGGSLFIQAGLDDNLGDDLKKLFYQAVQPAALSN